MRMKKKKGYLRDPLMRHQRARERRGQLNILLDAFFGNRAVRLGVQRRLKSGTPKAFRKKRK
jgi:hypothetical protein